MENVIPSFQYEPLIFSSELETSNEEEDRGNTNGVKPLGTKTKKEELAYFEGGKDSSQKDAVV
jgi:hypothetical protein